MEPPDFESVGVNGEGDFVAFFVDIEPDEFRMCFHEFAS
jgi:hypothetical protein